MGKGAKANVRAIAAKEQAVTMLRAVLGREPTEDEVDKALGAAPKPAVVVQGGGKVAVAKAVGEKVVAVEGKPSSSSPGSFAVFGAAGVTDEGKVLV